MSISLYEASVRGYLQTLDGLGGVLQRGRDYCQEHNIDLAHMVEARLFKDMRPLRFQVQRVITHSVGALDAIRNGAVTLPGEAPQHDYAGLQILVADVRETLAQLTPAEVDAFAGKEVVFEVPGRPRRVFSAEGFVLSFSIPNLHFHAATAYDILRAQGVPLSKLDYMGSLMLKQAFEPS
ncbi:MAG TPA: DUF1993 domain-containing protein [Caulobacteraceae bacterium]